jgi:hypothetical protein
MRWRKLAGLSWLGLTGCAHYTASVDMDTVPTGREAYLYGRFELETEEPERLLDKSHSALGFAVECDDGEAYVLRFMVSNPLQVIAIEPSSCVITELLFTNNWQHVLQRTPAPTQLMPRVRLEAGKAYYLGDFFASISLRPQGENVVLKSWDVHFVRHDYRATTRIMKAWWPGLARLETKDIMTAPPTDSPYAGPTDE